jgi:hypothetical protein
MQLVLDQQGIMGCKIVGILGTGLAGCEQPAGVDNQALVLEAL